MNKYHLASGYPFDLSFGDEIAYNDDGTVGIAFIGKEMPPSIGVFDTVEYTTPKNQKMIRTYWIGGTKTKNNEPAIMKLIENPIFNFEK